VVFAGGAADVFASANTTNMTTITDQSLASGTPKVFARNQAEIMVGAGNPKHVQSVSDLADPALKVVLCAPDVPCGSLAQDVFKNAGVKVSPVSEETSVGGVVTKVSTGEADAGIVYETDVKSAGDDITVESGLRSMNQRLEDAARSLGAPRRTVFLRVTLPLIWPSLAAGTVLTWARALGEFGATITFAGNLPGVTQTMPLAIYISQSSNMTDEAIALSLILVVVSLVVMIFRRDRSGTG
jgi:hypothetical protein